LGGAQQPDAIGDGQAFQGQPDDRQMAGIDIDSEIADFDGELRRFAVSHGSYQAAEKTRRGEPVSDWDGLGAKESGSGLHDLIRCVLKGKGIDGRRRGAHLAQVGVAVAAIRQLPIFRDKPMRGDRRLAG